MPGEGAPGTIRKHRVFGLHIRSACQPGAQTVRRLGTGEGDPILLTIARTDGDRAGGEEGP